MKIRLLVIAVFAGSVLLSSCSKEEYFGPVDAATGTPLYQTRGGEDGSETDGGSGSGTDGITDSGHDSDYDNSNKKRKNP